MHMYKRVMNIPIYIQYSYSGIGVQLKLCKLKTNHVMRFLYQIIKLLTFRLAESATEIKSRGNHIVNYILPLQTFYFAKVIMIDS